jgi:general L-amino acid transport system substrate-binding protein
MAPDICRALAAATLGDASAVEFIPVTLRNRFSALRDDTIDVILRTTPWNFSRDAGEGVQFIGPYFMDETVVMVRRESGITDLSMLDENTICVLESSPADTVIRDLAASANARINIISVGSSDQYLQAYEDGRCVGIADGNVMLQAPRLAFADPDEHVFVGERLGFSPLVIGVSEGEDQWADIVRWVFFALATAEEYGVTGASVEEIARTTQVPILRRMLAPEAGSAAQLRLEDDWAVRAIAAAGNLEEIYNRSFGPDSNIPIPRGPSALWLDGGLILAPPF